MSWRWCRCFDLASMRKDQVMPAYGSDETCYRLLMWDGDQPRSENLGALILNNEGYAKIDPSHPMGGPDGGRDATCDKDGNPWIMAVYFPRGEKSAAELTKKFKDDLAAASKHGPHGLAFVTNQEITLGERGALKGLGAAVGIEVDLFHQARISFILNTPEMAGIRNQFLHIDSGPTPMDLDLVIDGAAHHFIDGTAFRDQLIDRSIEKCLEQFALDNPDTGSGSTGILGSVPDVSDLYRQFGGGSRKETSEQLEHRLRRWKDQAIAGWVSSSETYLAATVRPGLRFHLRDIGGTFLNHVEIVITIQGARGIEWESPDDFELDKLLPPIDPPPDDIYGFQATRYLMNHLRPKDYPLTWENRGDAVFVTINLGHLRPTGWSSNDDDLVLEVSDPSKPLTAQWTVTAQGYGKVFVGSEVLIPVEVLTPRDAFTQEAEKRGSSG